MRARHHPPLGFRDYLVFRKHDLTSSSRPSWSFVLHVLAEPDFPPVATLPELASYLREAAVPAEVERAAQAAWKSFSAYKSRRRKALPADAALWQP